MLVRVSVVLRQEELLRGVDVRALPDGVEVLAHEDANLAYFINIYIYIYTHTYTCIYIYIYDLCIYIYIYTYI